MQSVTKSRLTEQQVTTLAKAAFGADARVGEIKEMKGGMFNAVYSVALPDKEETVVLKVSVPPGARVLRYEKDLMRREVEVYRLLAEQTDLPVPRVLYSDFSCALLPSPYFFMSRVQGAGMLGLRAKLSPADMEEVKGQLGACFARLHAVQGAHFGYFPAEGEKRFSTWRGAFTDMVQSILQDGREGGIRLPYEEVERTLAANAHCLDEITEPCLINFDLWAGNVFLAQTEGGWQVQGIVDWERAFYGDPVADFAGAVMVVGDIEKEQALWQGYRDVNPGVPPLTPEALRRYHLYKMYLALIMAVEIYRYGPLYGALQRLYALRELKKRMKALQG